MIRIKNLKKSFGEGDKRITVLENFNAHMKQGQITAIIGGSGSGKSTVLKHLIGAYRPDSGEIWIDGEEVSQFKGEELNRVRKKFGIMFQSGALFNSLTVEDNVALPMREHTDLNEGTILIMVKMKLEMVGLRGAEHLKPAQLSGGMIKRIALARAILTKPEILILDEATSALDSESERMVQAALETLKAGRTTLVIAHRLSTIRRADQIIVLADGRLTEQGNHQVLLDRKGDYSRLFDFQIHA